MKLNDLIKDLQKIQSHIVGNNGTLAEYDIEVYVKTSEWDNQQNRYVTKLQDVSVGVEEQFWRHRKNNMVHEFRVFINPHDGFCGD